jgi:hypothetical protein
MVVSNAYLITLIVVGSLTWLVFVLGMAKLSKFYIQFTVFRRDMDTNLTGMGTNIKKMQNSISELIIEQRRTNKLMLELIDIKKYENMGTLEFEEVQEEPVQEEPVQEEQV